MQRAAQSGLGGIGKYDNTQIAMASQIADQWARAASATGAGAALGAWSGIKQQEPQRWLAALSLLGGLEQQKMSSNPFFGAAGAYWNHPTQVMPRTPNPGTNYGNMGAMAAAGGGGGGEVGPETKIEYVSRRGFHPTLDIDTAYQQYLDNYNRQRQGQA